MQIISSCTILFMLILNSLCAGKEDVNISFIPAEVTAVSGLCALISCTINYSTKAKRLENIVWYFKETEVFDNSKGHDQEQIKMLEPDLNKNNCSIIIKNITKEMAGKYSLSVHGNQKNKVKIIIQDTPVIVFPPLREHEQADLICSAPFPCPETPPCITWWIKKKEGNMTEMKENITLITSQSFYNSTLTFIPTSEHHNATVGCEARYGNNTINTSRTIEVMYVQNLEIVGNDTVKEGDTLRLNCTVDSHPASSDPVWIFTGTTDHLMNHISAGSLTITNVNKQHAKEYVCVVSYMTKLLISSINITVSNTSNTNDFKNETMSPEGLNAGEDGNLTGKDTNVNTIITAAEDFLKTHLKLSIILTFLIGMATSAVIFAVGLCCWVSCKRGKKHKGLAVPSDAGVFLETVQTNIDPMVTNEQTPLHDQFDERMSNEQVQSTDGAEEKVAGEEETGAGEERAEEVNYATIDYSLLKKKQPEEEQRETVDTDYAEIKRDGKGRVGPPKEDDQTEMSNGGSEKQNEGEELYGNSQAIKGQA